MADEKDEKKETAETKREKKSAAKKAEEQTEREAKARDNLEGGRLAVIAGKPTIYEGEEYEEGDEIDMNKQDAINAVRFGGAKFAGQEEENKAKGRKDK